MGYPICSKEANSRFEHSITNLWAMLFAMGSISGHTVNLRFVQGSGLLEASVWYAIGDRRTERGCSNQGPDKGRTFLGYKVQGLQLLVNALELGDINRHAWSNIMHKL